MFILAVLPWLVLGAAFGGAAFGFQKLTARPRSSGSSKSPRDFTLLERHVAFFQGANWNTNYVTLGDFLGTLKELGVGPKRYVVALVIMVAGRSKTTSGSLFRPLVVFRPNVAKMIHAPADTGSYQPDGSVARKFEDLADPALGVVTRESVFKWITQRNGGKSPSLGQKGEFEILFEVLERKRGRAHLTRAELEQLYDGTLLFELAGRKPPWQ
jgi:hypothetical protein